MQSEEMGGATVKRGKISRLFAVGLVFAPWLGCGTTPREYDQPSSDAGASAGGAGADAGAGNPGDECALTLCDGACIDTMRDPKTAANATKTAPLFLTWARLMA